MKIKKKQITMSIQTTETGLTFVLENNVLTFIRDNVSTSITLSTEELAYLQFFLNQI